MSGCGDRGGRGCAEVGGPAGRGRVDLVGGGQEGGGASLTGYLRLDGGLLAAAQQLRLDGLHHTLEAPAGS